MAELVLILLAGGVMMASAVPDPASVTLHWLRLAGIIALSMCGLAMFFHFRRAHEPNIPEIVGTIQKSLFVASSVAILGQLAFVQIGKRAVQRFVALAAFLLCLIAAVNVLNELSPHDRMEKPFAVLIQTISSAGVAAFCGLALMEMLLGHAYLTASTMTIAPFQRLNRWLVATLTVRCVCAIGLMLVVNYLKPIDRLWTLYGPYILTRWLVGLLVPAVFIFMARDCIRRRSTQSATGILYVAVVLIFLGEFIAIQLVRDTVLPH